MGEGYKKVSVIPPELKPKIKAIYPISAKVMEEIEQETWKRIEENFWRREWAVARSVFDIRTK